MDPATLGAALAQARKQLRNRDHFGLLPAPPCAGRPHRASQFSAQTAVTFQRVYQMHNDAAMIRLVFQNMAPQGSPEENSVGTFTLKAAVVWDYQGATQTAIPVTFGGGIRTITMDKYTVAVSDPIPVSFLVSTGGYFVVRSYVTQSGTNLPTSNDGDINLGINGWNEGYLAGDFTDSAANAFGGSTRNGTMFGPVAVCGWPSTGRNKAVALIGDSIVAGTGWQKYEGSYGFANYALYQAQVPAVNVARSGETTQTVAGAIGQIALRMATVYGCKYALCNYGTNDLPTRTLAQIKADLITLWTYLARLGITPYHTTILPRTTSTDNWQTVGAQALYNGSGPEAIRQSLNQWLRAPASAGAGNSALVDAAGVFAGVMDITPAVEVNANGSAITVNAATGAISNGVGGFWKVDATVYQSGTLTSVPSSQKMDDSTKTWTLDQFTSYWIVITADATTPASVGQAQQITYTNPQEVGLTTGLTTVPSVGAAYQFKKIYTIDGIHPSSTAHRLMAALVNTAAFA